jgi:hypothetical protein
MMEIDLRVRKWEVVDWLRRQTEARSYAQIVSNTTSPKMLQRPELAEFGSITAFTYASDFQRDERPASRHLPTLGDIEGMVSHNRAMSDIVFVDPWHTYDDSLRVLQLGYGMVSPGGYLVVHDCNPGQSEFTVMLPEHCAVCWCGDTWRAFVDFTANLPADTEWWTLASDLGVGVIRAAECPPPARRGRRARPRSSFAPLVPSNLDVDEKWAWLEANREQALRLVSVEQWYERTD